MLIKLLKDDKGSTVVLFAIMATVFLGITALVVDYGLLTVQKQRLELKTDAAALAGAQELPNEASALAKAQEYAQKNNLVIDNTLYTIAEDKKSVGVSSYKVQPLNFARVFQKEKSPIGARSKAKLSPITKVKGAVPLGIDNRTLNYGQYVSLKVAPENDTDYLLGAGNYGVLALSGVGSSNYENDLKHGFQSFLSVGQIVALQTGNISGATKTGVEYRVNQCNHTPQCTPEAFERDCSRVITVPVYEVNEIYGSQQQVKNIKIVGFAAFFLDNYTRVGNENYVNGYFVRKIEPGEYSEVATDYGINVVHLTKW